jgi:uncharacterized RDD family membrane protein YckC
MHERRESDPPQTPAAPKPASLLLRGVAVLLDSAIIFIVAVVIIGPGNLGRGAGLALYMAGWAAYYIGFTATMGATPGKVAMGIHVAGKDGGKPQPDSVILRYVVLMAGALPFGVGTIISILLVLTDPQRRSLHDRIAGTLVLDGRPPLEEWRR